MLTLADIDNDLVKLVAITGFITLGLTFIIAASITTVAKSRHREETRREVAAYVAEGSMTPQDAAMLLSGGEDAVRSSVTSALAWGTINAKDAERLLRATGPAGSGPRPNPNIDPDPPGVNNAHGNPHPAA